MASIAILGSKALLDLAATISFAIGRQWPMALMFAGFTIADAGAAWIVLR